MPELSAEAIEDSMRGLDFIERNFGFQAAQQLQASYAADPRAFDIYLFMIGMALRMSKAYRRDIRETCEELRRRLKPKDGA